MAQYPIILKRNYINKDDTITVSSGDTSKVNMYDWNRKTDWESSGSDDTTNETIEAIFYEGVATVNRDIDRLILLDTNVKDFELEYDNGSGWTSIADTNIDNNSDENVYITFTKITNVSKIRFNMLKTIVANEEKKLSELIIGEYDFVLTDTTTGQKTRADEGSKNHFRLERGDLVSFHDWDKYAETITIRNLSSTLRNSLKTLYDEEKAFIFIWDYEDLTNWINQVVWVNVWNERKTHKLPYYTIRIDLKGV